MLFGCGTLPRNPCTASDPFRRGHSEPFLLVLMTPVSAVTGLILSRTHQVYDDPAAETLLEMGLPPFGRL